MTAVESRPKKRVMESDDGDDYADSSLEEDEDEVDDMADFIDDDCEENTDYSVYIRDLFGYDRRKYVCYLVVVYGISFCCHEKCYFQFLELL